jgi:hypothetical protein
VGKRGVDLLVVAFALSLVGSLLVYVAWPALAPYPSAAGLAIAVAFFVTAFLVAPPRKAEQVRVYPLPVDRAFPRVLWAVRDGPSRGEVNITKVDEVKRGITGYSPYALPSSSKVVWIETTPAPEGGTRVVVNAAAWYPLSVWVWWRAHELAAKVALAIDAAFAPPPPPSAR